MLTDGWTYRRVHGRTDRQTNGGTEKVITIGLLYFQCRALIRSLYTLFYSLLLVSCLLIYVDNSLHVILCIFCSLKMLFIVSTQTCIDIHVNYISQMMANILLIWWSLRFGLIVYFWPHLEKNPAYVGREKTGIRSDAAHSEPGLFVTNEYLQKILFSLSSQFKNNIWPASRKKGSSDITNNVDPDQLQTRYWKQLHAVQLFTHSRNICATDVTSVKKCRPWPVANKFLWDLPEAKKQDRCDKDCPIDSN